MVQGSLVPWMRYSVSLLPLQRYMARAPSGFSGPPFMPMTEHAALQTSCASPEPIRSPTTTRPVAMPTRVCSEAPRRYHLRLESSFWCAAATLGLTVSSCAQCGSLRHLIRGKEMVKCSKAEVRRLETALQWKILLLDIFWSWLCCNRHLKSTGLGSDPASIIERSPISPSPVLVAPQSTRRSDRDFLPPTLGRLIGGLLFSWRADRHRPETAFPRNIYGMARKAARSSSSTIGFCKTAATLSGGTGKVA